MRAAEPNELKSHAYPVLAAAISEAELEKWFPVSFHHITNPQEAAEPSKAALIRLDAGDCFVLYYGELSNQLMLRIPTSTDASTFLNSFFREVPLPRPRILWRRKDAHLPSHIAAKTIKAPATTLTGVDLQLIGRRMFVAPTALRRILFTTPVVR